MENQWKERENAVARYKCHLRPLCANIEFSSLLPNNPLLEVIEWMKGVFLKGQSLLQQPADKFPRAFISKRMALYLTEIDKEGKESINASRYEILVYRQIAQQMQTGAIHIEDSVRHRTFYHELTPADKKESILATLNIPWLKIPFEEHLDSLFKEHQKKLEAFTLLTYVPITTFVTSGTCFPKLSVVQGGEIIQELFCVSSSVFFFV